MKIYINHIFSNVIMLWYCSAICISNVHWHSVHKIMYISTAQKRCGQFDQNQFDDKEKLCIIIFSYLHLLPETQSLECSFSDLKNLVLKDEKKCEKNLYWSVYSSMAKLVHKETKQTLWHPRTILCSHSCTDDGTSKRRRSPPSKVQSTLPKSSPRMLSSPFGN